MKSLSFDLPGLPSLAEVCQAISPYSIWVFEKSGKMAGFLDRFTHKVLLIWLCGNNNKFFYHIIIIIKKPLYYMGKITWQDLPDFAKLPSCEVGNEY